MWLRNWILSNVNVNSYRWVVATILDSTATEAPNEWFPTLASIESPWRPAKNTDQIAWSLPPLRFRFNGNGVKVPDCALKTSSQMILRLLVPTPRALNCHPTFRFPGQSVVPERKTLTIISLLVQTHTQACTHTHTHTHTHTGWSVDFLELPLPH